MLITPRHVQLSGIVGDTVESVVRLQGQKKEPLIVKLGSLSIADKVEVDLREVEKGQSYELKIRNKVKGEARYSGTIELATNYPDRPEIAIKIQSNIRPPIEVVPRTLNFGDLSADRLKMIKEKEIMMRRPVLVVLNKGEGLEIKKAELKNSLFRVSYVRPLQSGRVVQLQIEADLDKLKKGANLDQLRIYTNQTDETALEVPVQIQIE